MSARDSSGRGGPMVTKLKEGLQEAIVFLQTLGSYRIPAVIERRRKELLDKLMLLQGGSIKEIPVIEPDQPAATSISKPTAEAEDATKVKVESSENSSASSSTVTSPSHGKPIKRRDSAIVSTLVKDYETIHTTAKKEEESETPKRFVTLKRVAKPTDFPASADKVPEENDSKKATPEPESKAEDVKEDNKVAESKAESTSQMDSLDVADGRRERASSIVSGEDSNEEEDEDDKKKKKKSKGGFGLKKVKGFMKRDKSPVPERKNKTATADVPQEEKPEEEEGEKFEEAEPLEEQIEEVQEEEEGVRISGCLMRMKKKMGLSKSAKQVNAKVCEATMMLGDKEELDLAKCSVELTDVGFDLTHPKHKSPLMFKVDGGEDLREKWVAAITEAIEKATPPEEEKPEEDSKSITNDAIPSITVEDVASSLPPMKKGKRESKALTPKPEKKLPDQGVALKGSFLRKKPGISRSWEKTFCVLTYQAFYFSNEADTKDYSNMLPIYPNMDVKLESKKGKGDNPGLCLKMGKKQELFSFENQADFQSWKSAIESVLGIGGVEELLSEDEEEDGNEGPEELYEELELDESVPPAIPASPRPNRPNFSAPSVPAAGNDDFAIDEDIYEETDDILPTMPQAQSPQHVPSLPNRNPPKNLSMSAPVPSLPPRNAPATAVPAPSLPPRAGSGGKAKGPAPAPMDYEDTAPPKIGAKPGAKAPAPPPAASIEEDQEELYDDVVVGGEGETGGGGEPDEMYDDVVMGADGGDNADEELYDDVMTTSGLPSNNNTKPAEPISEEYYEDMAPGTVSDPYVALEKNKEEEVEPGDELYVDVDEPAAAPIQKVQAANTLPARTASPKFSMKFNKKAPSGSGTSRGLVNGSIGYKAPKKSKFDDRWACVEGSNLLVFKSSGDKRHQDKISLGDCRLDIGSTEAGAGKFAFSVSKGDKFYHFSLKSKAEVDNWVEVLKGIVKYAPIEAGNGGLELEAEIYQAKEDHIADSNDELTFKKGTYIKLIERKSKDLWYGQIGNDSQIFEGKKGYFPIDKVELAEDLYV